MQSDLTSSSRRALDPSSTCTVVQCTALELVQLGVVILLFSMTNPRPSCRVKRTLLVVVKSVCKGNTAGSYFYLNFAQNDLPYYYQGTLGATVLPTVDVFRPSTLLCPNIPPMLFQHCIWPRCLLSPIAGKTANTSRSWNREIHLSGL